MIQTGLHYAQGYNTPQSHKVDKGVLKGVLIVISFVLMFWQLQTISINTLSIFLTTYILVILSILYSRLAK